MLMFSLARYVWITESVATTGVVPKTVLNGGSWSDRLDSPVRWWQCIPFLDRHLVEFRAVYSLVGHASVTFLCGHCEKTILGL